MRRTAWLLTQKLRLFQSTHSQGVRPPSAVSCLRVKTISIHALTRSATAYSKLPASPLLNFNPRTHKECDDIPSMKSLAQIIFQSTHSQGVRLKTLPKPTILGGYFNPRTHKECDRRVVPTAQSKRYFNPRTHKECDLNAFTPAKCTKNFNPRTHKECDIASVIRTTSSIYFNPRTHKECDRNI